jgi:hypothetical protein
MMIKISPDKEKAKSIYSMALEREKFVREMGKNARYPTIIADSYYEIIKELCTAIGLSAGYKCIGENAHKDLIDSMKKHGLSDDEMVIVHDLRIKRNKSSYEGKQIEKIYLENNEGKLIKIIGRLKKILGEKIK